LGSVVFLGFLGFERIVYLRHLFLCLHFLYCFDFVGAFAGGKGQVQYFDCNKEIDGVTTQNGD
jgi:hypothetical protein